MEMDLKLHFYGSRGIQIPPKMPQKSLFQPQFPERKGGSQPLFQLGWLRWGRKIGIGFVGIATILSQKKGRIWVRSVPGSAGNPQGFRECLITAGKKGKNSAWCLGTEPKSQEKQLREQNTGIIPKKRILRDGRGRIPTPSGQRPGEKGEGGADSTSRRQFQGKFRKWGLGVVEESPNPHGFPWLPENFPWICSRFCFFHLNFSTPGRSRKIRRNFGDLFVGRDFSRGKSTPDWENPQRFPGEKKKGNCIPNPGLESLDRTILSLSDAAG